MKIVHKNEIYGAVINIADIFKQDINYLVKLKAEIDAEIQRKLKNIDNKDTVVIRSDGRNIWEYYSLNLGKVNLGKSAPKPIILKRFG